MDSIVNTFSFELEHGGPHVHFLAFLLFIFIGIVILHGVFRIVIEVLSRVTKIPRDSWRNIFRFMPTLLGILMGIQLTKDILNLPDVVQNILSYHYHISQRRHHYGDFLLCPYGIVFLEGQTVQERR